MSASPDARTTHLGTHWPFGDIQAAHHHGRVTVLEYAPMRVRDAEAGSSTVPREMAYAAFVDDRCITDYPSLDAALAAQDAAASLLSLLERSTGRSSSVRPTAAEPVGRQVRAFLGSGDRTAGRLEEVLVRPDQFGSERLGRIRLDEPLWGRTHITVPMYVVTPA